MELEHWETHIKRDVNTTGWKFSILKSLALSLYPELFKTTQTANVTSGRPRLHLARQS